ncbi:MAG: family acetyltransferase [Holophagaceae bacterium]|nr:family acetyltransferase [Holophagaceae bacterium]
MVTIRQISAPEPGLLPQLADLLMDAVHQGASISFLAPLSAERAEAYWTPLLASLGPAQALWVAEEGGKVLGSVQLAQGQKENGRHRGEIQKLLVTSLARGMGISTRLMEAAEAYARAQGLTLLLLDTQTGSKAEGIYMHWGWRKAGEIPDFAASPDGVLHPTSYFSKRLD